MSDYLFNGLKRMLATRYAWSFLGRWYKWGGDDPSGFDCSGLVIEILTAVGILPRGFDTTAEGLFKRFTRYRVPNPDEGCLVFYEKRSGKIIHVEYCIDNYHSIGASGGGKEVVDTKTAIEKNAFIKLRPIRATNLFVDPFKILE